MTIDLTNSELKARVAELEAELEDVQSELESLRQFTRSEIGKLPSDYVRFKQGRENVWRAK